MKNKMISVIVPVYNAEKYLKEAIQSVLNQTYSNFELILINDGSVDHSMDILRNVTDERVRVVNKKNTGVSDTRNIAIKMSKGEYVCFLDADDCYSPYYLERMYETAVEKDADMVVCNYVPYRKIPDFDYHKTTATCIHDSDTLLRLGVLTSAWTKLIKTSVLQEYDILFDKNMTFGEDLFFCWKVFLASKRIWMIDENLYGYRIIDGGATSKYHSELYEKYKIAFDSLKSFGKQIGKNDEYEMDVFLATRIPSFVMMTIREKSSLISKRKRLLKILDDETIQRVYKEWDSFEKKINPGQSAFYKKCKKKKVVLLLLNGYKREITTWIKNKIKGLLW